MDIDEDDDAMASIDEDKQQVNDDEDVSMPTSLSRSACKRLASTHDAGDVAGGGGGCACVSIKRKNMWRSSRSPRRDELSSLNSTYELELTRAGVGGGGGGEEEEEEEKSDVMEN